MNKREAFTLIEVMVAVMIISVVIAALLRLEGENTLLLQKAVKTESTLGFMTLLNQSSYGFENESLHLDRLVERFDIDDDLRRELKAIPVEIRYQKVERIDLSAMQDDVEKGSQSDAPLLLEIGKSVLKLPHTSLYVLRVTEQ